MLHRPRSPLGKPWLGALALALGLVHPSTARGNSPFLVVPDPAVAEATPAYRYANMSDADAFEELDRRKILYSKVDPIPGVRAPIRLTGRLHGVYIHSALPPDERVTSMFEILDARLALALDDFAALLERHDIDEVVHYTMYRPNVAAPGNDKEGHAAEGPPKIAAALPGARRQRASTKPAEPAEKPQAAKKPLEKAAPEKKAAEKSVEKAAPEKKAIEKAVEKAAPEKKTIEKITKKSAFDLDKKRDTKREPKRIGHDGARGSKQKSPAISVKQRGPVASVRPAEKPIVRRGTWAPPGTRHPAGLAIDVGLLHKRDGRWLSVAQHFQGNIGDRTCGEGVPLPVPENARELHTIVCEAYALGIFTYTLTPNYNEAHADHFHMEIKPGVRWFLYH